MGSAHPRDNGAMWWGAALHGGNSVVGYDKSDLLTACGRRTLGSGELLTANLACKVLFPSGRAS